MYLNPGVYKPSAMLDHASSLELLIEIAQARPSTPSVQHNVFSQLVPEVYEGSQTHGTGARAFVSSLRDLDLDSISEVELKVYVSKHKESISSAIDIDVDIISFVQASESRLQQWQ